MFFLNLISNFFYFYNIELIVILDVEKEYFFDVFVIVILDIR